MIEFFVPGIPVPKGSGRAFYNKKAEKAFVVQTNRERQEPWVSLIAWTAAKKDMGEISGPVSLELHFTMPRPKTHFRSNGDLKPNAPTWHVKVPDLDKLERAVLDALTNVIWRNDSQVAKITSRKYYGLKPGVAIKVEEIVA